jgi:NADP-dependent aldehyde dehydrogenase
MLQSIDARTGKSSGAGWSESTAPDIEAAVSAAAAAADDFAASSAADRSALLRDLAAGLEGEREKLLLVADRETGLGLARLSSELDRTIFQLNGFADVIDSGVAHSVVDDAAIPGNPPIGRPRLTRTRLPVGPVAMFSASNFPFAFSVLGGDSASALAAGCPVVVKAHPAHPQLSRDTAMIAQRIVAARRFSPGVFQFVQGGSIEVGVALVRAPAIAAVSFTGSFQGGTALAKVAAERPRPIPFYGEMGSVNPLVVLQNTLDHGASAAAAMLAGSIGLGAGQFCTGPGVILVPASAAGDAFVRLLADAVKSLETHAMLSAGIRSAYDRGVERWRRLGVGTELTEDGPAAHPLGSRPYLAEVTGQEFIAHHELREEVFGSAALVVRSTSIDEAVAVLKAVGGALTVTLWGAEEDTQEHRRLVRAATQVAGRVLFSGVPTGVAVSHSQHHGGPYPATTQPFATSVGYFAIDRFLRPVALQDAPEWLIQRHGVPC